MSRCRSGSRTTFKRVEHRVLLNLHTLKNIVHLPRMADAEASPNRGVMIVLAYLWPLALVPLLLEKHDPEVQWHAKHGLVLMVGRADPDRRLHGGGQHRQPGDARARLRARCSCSCSAGSAILALHVVAILKGVSGSRLILPGLSHYADRF